MNIALPRPLTGLLLALLAIGISGCGSSSSNNSSGSSTNAGPVKNGGSAVVMHGDAWDGWVPDSTVTSLDFQVHISVMEPLFRMGVAGQGFEGSGVLPGIGKSYTTSADGKTLTVRLTPGVKFSNGQPVTAADVAWDESVWRAGPIQGLYYAGITSVTAPNPETVVFHLKQRNNLLPSVLTWYTSAVLPKNFAGMPAKTFWKAPIGAGPFVVKSTSSGGSSIVLTKNPDYYIAGEPHLNQLTFKYVPDVNSRVLQFQSGAAQILPTVPLDSATQLPSGTAKYYKSVYIESLIPNWKKAPLNNVHLRKALSLAIDRSALVKGVLNGQAQLPKGELPNNLTVPAGCPTCNWSEYNTTAAKQQLAQAGLKAGTTLTLTYDNSIGTAALTAQALQADFAKIGVTLQLKPVDYQTLFQDNSTYNYELALEPWYTIDPSPADAMLFLESFKWWWSGAPVAPLSQAASSFTTATSKSQEEQSVQTLETWAYNNVPMIPLYTPNIVVGVNTGVEGVNVLPWGSYYPSTIWLSK
jgi:peptide/nickel transport system substrate-binding protein